MKYIFVKKVMFEVEADSLENAYKAMKEVDKDSLLDDTAREDFEDAAGRKDLWDVIDNYDVDVLDSEYVGTEDEDDPEECLYDYLTNGDNTKKTSDIDRIAENLANIIKNILR